MNDDLDCAALDHSLGFPMRCGFPPAATVVREGETVGICQHHLAQTVVTGYVVTMVHEASK